MHRIDDKDFFSRCWKSSQHSCEPPSAARRHSVATALANHAIDCEELAIDALHATLATENSSVRHVHHPNPCLQRERVLRNTIVKKCICFCVQSSKHKMANRSNLGHARCGSDEKKMNFSFQTSSCIRTAPRNTTEIVRGTATLIPKCLKQQKNNETTKSSKHSQLTKINNDDGNDSAADGACNAHCDDIRSNRCGKVREIVPIHARRGSCGVLGARSGADQFGH